MFNLLLDALPAEYEGYLIRTDYRIGIQISQALEDEELEPYEKIGIALSRPALLWLQASVWHRT